MSGSGSTLFAIYRSERDREDAAMVLGSKHGVITPVETIATAVPGPKPLEYSSSDPHDPPH
jgi:4-diphosphocytidyl-2C-methyl-D-erythritol kinase